MLNVIAEAAQRFDILRSYDPVEMRFVPVRLLLLDPQRSKGNPEKEKKEERSVISQLLRAN